MLVVMVLLLSSAQFVFAEDWGQWVSCAQLSTPKITFQAEKIGGKIYAIGGHDNGGIISLVEEYNPDTNKWITRSSMSTERNYFQTEVIDGKIFAIGGSNNKNTVLSSVEVFDPNSNSWTSKASMKIPRMQSQIEVVNGKIYMIGGSSGGNGYLKSIEEYDPLNNTWNEKAPMSVPRCDFSTEVIEGKIYIIGGKNSDGVLSSIEVYDPVTDKCEIKGSMSSTKLYFSTEVINKKIFIIGGQNQSDNSGYLSAVEIYDPNSDSWIEGSPLLTKRAHFSTEIINGKIYALGGINDDGYASKFEVYDPKTDQWIEKTSMPTARAYTETIELGGSIYAIGGRNANYSTAVEKYTVPEEVPFNPSDLTATAGNSSVFLAWDTVDGAISYNVKRSTTAGGPYTDIATEVTGTTYTDTTAVNGTVYYYVVTAVNSAGESENSNEASATPMAPNTSLDVMSIDKATIGDEITADIVIHNANTICAEDIRITYDAARLEYIGSQATEGMKIYKEDNLDNGTNRYITASLGKDNAANGDKVLFQLKFRAKAIGEAKIDIVNGRIADNATIEVDVSAEYCGEKTILIEGIKDINRTGEFTLLDLGIAAWYYGDPASSTDSSKYDVDVIADGNIDDNDLTEAVTKVLANSNYPGNNL